MLEGEGPDNDNFYSTVYVVFHVFKYVNFQKELLAYTLCHPMHQILQ